MNNTWEFLVGFPAGVYNSFEEMVDAEYGTPDNGERKHDYNKLFREAVLLNAKHRAENPPPVKNPPPDKTK